MLPAPELPEAHPGDLRGTYRSDPAGPLAWGRNHTAVTVDSEGVGENVLKAVRGLASRRPPEAF